MQRAPSLPPKLCWVSCSKPQTALLTTASCVQNNTATSLGRSVHLALQRRAALLNPMQQFQTALLTRLPRACRTMRP